MMRRNSVSVVLVFICSAVICNHFCTVTYAEPAQTQVTTLRQGQKVYIDCGSLGQLELRSSLSADATNGKVICGAQVTFISEQDAWALIRTDDKRTGYISAAFLTAASGQSVRTSNSFSGSQDRSQPQPQNSLIDIRRLMNARQFIDAGLNKLSGAEIDALNGWLEAFAGRLLQNNQRTGDGGESVIETEIDGTFNGWSGDTIFKLTNGQIWQQSSYDYTYEYAYRPNVMIFPSGGRCKLKVEDVKDTIEVKRIK